MPQRLVLERNEAETLANLVADDLSALLPDLDNTRLALAAGLFDAAQLLRPGFPAWTTLDELAARLPRDAGGVVAFGAREGRMPAQALMPETQLASGAMLHLPWTLQTEARHAQPLGQAMETRLLGSGEAGARTADFLMRTLGMRLAHARYFSRHDLLALTCVHYEHAGLAPLWTGLEAALLSPHGTENTVSARGLPLRYESGTIHVASPLERLGKEPHENPAAAAHTLAGWIFELRQYAAVLAAHHVPLRIDGDADDRADLYLHQVADADPSLPSPTLYTHSAPGLGTVAITIAQVDGPRVHTLAHALVLGGALDDHLAHLAQRYATPATAHPLGRLVLDPRYALTVPPPQALH